MKYLYKFTFVALAVTARLYASAQDTGYFNPADQPTARQFASYYQLMVHTDSGWTFADHWINGRLKITGRISDDMKHRLGTFTYYDTAGAVTLRRKYVGNGGAIETRYYPEGQIMVQGPTLYEQKSGEWTGYYPSAKIKATAMYTDGQMDTASFFNEDGSANDTAKVFWQECSYPGGDGAWLRFLNKNLRYPDTAIISEIQGTVIVQFKVSKEGKTSDFTVIHTAGKDLDDGAVRVMKRSGDWQPEIIGGTAMDTYKTQPVVFTLGTMPHAQSAANDSGHDKIFTRTEIESAYPGGQRAWLRYLNMNVQYPREALQYRVQGTVVVQFIVDKEGKISDVHAVSGPETGGLREEAEHLIKGSRRWTPAVQNGRQVKSYKRQPIVFKLQY